MGFVEFVEFAVSLASACVKPSIPNPPFPHTATTGGSVLSRSHKISTIQK